MSLTANRTLTLSFLVFVAIVLAATTFYWVTSYKPSSPLVTELPDRPPKLPEPPEVIETETPIQDTEAEVTPPPEPVAEPDSTPAPKTPPLPSLNVSDSSVRQDLEKLSAGYQVQEQLMTMVTADEILRKFVIAVENAAQGKLSFQHPVLQPPTSPVEVTLVNDSAEQKLYQLTEKNYRRFEPYVTMLETISTDDLLMLYRRYQPLLEQAWKELGVPDSNFHARLKQAIRVVLNTPAVGSSPELIRPSVYYQYADQQLQNLPEIQKLLIRMGPDNAKRVKNKLREILQRLP